MFETSRGCWWGERAHCTFCGLNGQTMAYRAMSPDLAVAQFERLFDLSDRARHLLCVDNILPTEYITDVFPRVQPPEDEVIFYEVKADLSDSDLAVMRRAGVRLIQPGIEALASSTLTLMRKGVTSVQNVSLLISCLTHDVFPVWNLLVGFPGETGEVYSRYVEVMPHLVHLPPPSGAYPVRFDRFSPYFVKAAEFGLDLEPYDFYQMVYPFDREILARLAYYFMDKNSTAEYFVELVTWIQRIQAGIEGWKRAWTSEGRRPPELYREQRPQGIVAVDSRSGERAEHPIDADQARLLDSLRGPRRLADVAKELPDLDVGTVLAPLVELGLAFEDRQRAISLVLPQRTDERHYYSTTLRRVNGRVPDDGGFDPRQVRSPELVS
jgi:magnesium-protoporphyrin IX monomethyl ester (oxidative) cyclase